MKIVRLFLNFKADLNVEDNAGETILFSVVAGSNKNTEVLQLLVDLGLNVNHESKSGKTLLDEAKFYQNFEKCIKIMNFIINPFLLRTVDVDTAFPQLKIIKCLLKYGTKVHSLDCFLDINEVEKNRSLELALGRNFTRQYTLFEKDAAISKVVSFIIKHTYLNEVYDSDLFKDDKILYKLVGCNPNVILEHVAKLQSLNMTVDSRLLKSIPMIEGLDSYYKQCEMELIQAKNSKLNNSWITFYNFLVDGRKKLKNYAGNEDLIEDFRRNDCVKKFPIYGESINEKVRKGIER